MLLSTYLFLRNQTFLKINFYVALATNQIKQFRQKSYENVNYSINISVKLKSIIPNETVEIPNFHFSHYKYMEIISFHSNQSSYPTGIKNITFVEGNVLCKYAMFQLHPPYSF